MAAVTTFDGLLARISSEFDETFYLYQETIAARLRTTTATGDAHVARAAYCKTVPTMPAGVSSYIPVEAHIGAQTGGAVSVLIAELINLGSLDISGASGTFTDGSAMPTRTELGTSTVMAGAVIAEVTTILNATPGTYTITYVDQDGNGAETTAAATPTASATVGSAGFVRLNTTDWGVRDITAAARAAGTTPTGVIQFWGVIPISMTAVVASTPVVDDLIGSGMIRRLPASAKIGAFALTTSNNACALLGAIRMVGDS